MSNKGKWKRVCRVNGKGRRVVRRKVEVLVSSVSCREKESRGVEAVVCRAKGTGAVFVVSKEREGV